MKHQQNMPSISYRPDIDGLRAIAVLAVLFFHLDFSMFSGGYVGVDVFFVVSGFLITKIIVSEHSQSTFTFKKFYIRRIRRLAPAFIVTMIATLILAILLFSPAKLERFGVEFSSASVAASNFFYWLESGYFDIESKYKPLLHTWSLGVEEQFYLIWPFLTIIFLKYFNKKQIFRIYLTLSLLSLVYAEYFLYRQSTAAFYLLPSRVVEFSIGAMLVLHKDTQEKTNLILKNGLSILGIVLLFYSFVGLSDSTRFPGLFSLPVALGTALIIYSKNSFINTLLSTKTLVFTGKISYSLYLIHWPLIVFYTYKNSNGPDTFAKCAIIAVSIITAIFFYYLIEKPFRFTHDAKHDVSKNNRLFISCVCFIITAFVITGFVTHKTGFPGLNTNKLHLFSTVNLKQEKRKRQVARRKLAKNPTFTIEGTLNPNKKNALVVGNSHGVDGLNIIKSIFGDQHNYLLSALGGCPPYHPSVAMELTDRDKCIKIQKERYGTEIYHNIDYVVISTLFLPQGFAPIHLERYIKHLTNLGIRKIIILGGHYRLRNEMYEVGQKYTDISEAVESSIKDQFLYNEEIEKIALQYNCLFINKKQLLCQGDSCVYAVGDNPFTWDQGHLSYEFAQYLGSLSKKMVEEYLSL